jgi:hypothetical protein
MKKVLFIGHSHHEVTRSSRFFQELLLVEYDLVHVTVDPSNSVDIELIASLSLENYSFVLLWQIDFLASYFIRRGLPTVVCPMYDASGSLELAHWRAMAGAFIISFSLDIHFDAQAAGLESLYVKFFASKTILL